MVATDRIHSDTPENSRTPARRGRAVILCVERDPHVRDLERYFLEEAGFEVNFAEDGEQALTLARALHPAIVITEILVPRLDGLALCRRLKAGADTCDIAVLVLSLLAAQGRAEDAGADAFLGKPLAARRLVETARALLGAATGGPALLTALVPESPRDR